MLFWPEFKLPPINLWVMPSLKYNENTMIDNKEHNYALLPIKLTSENGEFNMFNQFLTDALGNDYYDDFSERGLSLFKKFYDDVNKSGNEKVLLPRKLTAENGARQLLAGEFWIKHQAFNEDEKITEIMIPWETIEAIYKKIVEHYKNK